MFPNGRVVFSNRSQGFSSSLSEVEGAGKPWQGEKAISLVFFIGPPWDMLYIMESQLTSLLLKPRRPISCLCMSGRGPHPRTPNHELRTQIRTSWTASSGTSSRRDAIIVRERLAKPGNLEKLSRARARILVGFHDDTTRRRRNAEATRAATFTRTDNTPAVGYRKSNLPSVFLSVPRIRYQRTSVSPFHTVFHSSSSYLPRLLRKSSTN